jgi:hypothetical protein
VHLGVLGKMGWTYEMTWVDLGRTRRTRHDLEQLKERSMDKSLKEEKVCYMALGSTLERRGIAIPNMNHIKCRIL